MENLLYCALGALALPFRYYLSETQACKLIGVEISETGTETGFQNAISIPSSTSMSLATWALIIGVIMYLAYEYGWGALGIGVLVFFGISVVAGATIMPKPASDHFLKRIYASMAGRYANYEKENDDVRAAAMRDLVNRVESKYADRVTHLD